MSLDSSLATPLLGPRPSTLGSPLVGYVRPTI